VISNSKLIVILGPTASGKTALSLELARRLETDIISADSRTIYKEMNIGTAKPEGQKILAAELNLVKIEAEGIHSKNFKLDDLFTEKPYVSEGVNHWGIDLISPAEQFSAADFKIYAESHIDRLNQNNKIPLLVGGTGLYISAIVDQLEFGEVPPNLQLREELSELSSDELLERLNRADVDAKNYIDIYNRRRLERAVEVLETTGKKWLDNQKKGQEKYRSLQFGLDIDRDTLYERINNRVDSMIAKGLIDEARLLREKYGSIAPGLNAIGYRQLCAFFDGYISLKDAIELIKRDSRHYAKRQLAWFKRDSRIIWIKSISEMEQKISDL
jgi:tRNA dimethylallyltransferase